ncbi:MAG: autotransporter strand-loop-strand O-heptosyltransferase [Sporomusaceae bacterium]|nr:autotransporter strand-loop-strand O-heptosyltransferase [Sporomusaceae bacterium]
MNSYMTFYNGPLTCKTDIEGLEFDFNHGARIKVPPGNWRVKIIDRDAELTLYDDKVDNSMVTSTKKYYVNFRLEIYRDDRLVLEHNFNPAKRKVLLQYPRRSIIGDTLAAFAYGQVFQYLHHCQVYCAMDRKLAALLQPTYPDIHFIDVDERPNGIYATYYIGYFFPCNERIYHPVDWRVVGLQQAIAAILGLNVAPVRTEIAPTATKRLIAEPYVCIAAQATSQAKYWNNPTGWLETIAYLKARGYRVICIGKENSHGVGNRWNTIPYGAEDFTGDRPLSERVNLLYYADFFVGLSSGLSWLAWSVGKPVVMISGFTLPINEFYTPYRVINYHVCNSCFNDSKIEFSNQAFDWCPRWKETPRQFECTRLITSQQVIRAIEKLRRDYGLDYK